METKEMNENEFDLERARKLYILKKILFDRLKY